MRGDTAEHQRMVSSDAQRIRETGEETSAGVTNEARLPVHHQRCVHDGTRSAEDDAETLVSEADAEERNRRVEGTDDVEGAHGILRTMRSGRNDDAIRTCIADVRHPEIRNRKHRTRSAERRDLLVQVPRERIAVVDEDDLHARGSVGEVPCHGKALEKNRNDFLDEVKETRSQSRQMQQIMCHLWVSKTYRVIGTEGVVQ